MLDLQNVFQACCSMFGLSENISKFLPPFEDFMIISTLFGKGSKKKLVENSTKGGWSATADFPLRKKINNMGLKHWILPKNHFKTHLFFSIFGWGGPFSAQILVRRAAQT